MGNNKRHKNLLTERLQKKLFSKWQDHLGGGGLKAVMAPAIKIFFDSFPD